MPLSLNAALPPAATLGVLLDRYSELAALSPLGIWVPENDRIVQSGGTVSSMSARVGTGTFVQATGSRQPQIAVRDARNVLRGTGGGSASPGVMGLSGLSLSARSTLSIALAFHQTGAGDVQQLCGCQSPIARITFRNTAGQQFYRYDGGADIDSAKVASYVGWRRVIFCQGNGLSQISVDGGPFLSVANATADMPTFALMGSIDNSASFDGDIRALGLFSQDLTASSSQLALVNAWLLSEVA